MDETKVSDPQPQQAPASKASPTGGSGADNAGAADESKTESKTTMVKCGQRTFDLASLRESLADAERIAQKMLDESKAPRDENNNSSNNNSHASDESKRNEDDANSRVRKTSKGTPQRKTSKTFVPPKHLLLYLVRMGSFTSAPKVIPAANADDADVDYPETREDLQTFLGRCRQQLGTLPPPIDRTWKKPASEAEAASSASGQGEAVRVFQWNVLSQTLGTHNDNFVKCPSAALDWRTRRFRMLEEIARHDADVICLQEVDHFRFLRKSLSALGYAGHFFPKPDSPCLYLPENAGPDGCAIFYRKDKFDLQKVETRVIEVWHVESNQVLLALTLRSRASGESLIVATTHLKARNGALLSTLRNEQGKDIVDFLSQRAGGSVCGASGLGMVFSNSFASGLSGGALQQWRANRMRPSGSGTSLAGMASAVGSAFSPAVPVILTGDFNAEPTEPIYNTMTDKNNKLKLRSAYASASEKGAEPSYTTWKIREDGEHVQTLDYIFHSGNANRLKLEAMLDFPTGEQIGENRLPSVSYASDHFSLVADFRLMSSFRK